MIKLVFLKQSHIDIFYQWNFVNGYKNILPRCYLHVDCYKEVLRSQRFVIYLTERDATFKMVNMGEEHAFGA